MNRRLALLPVTAALLTAAACSSGSGSGSSNPAATTTAAVEAKPASLTLVAYSAFARPDALDAFTASTGIKVEIVDAGDTGAMVSKAVLTAGKPEGDVLWGVDDPNVSRVLDAKVFSDHPAADAAALDPALTGYLPALTPVDVGDVCLNIDKAWFADHGVTPPTGFDDLVAPAYKDLLVVENPSTSSPGLGFLLATIASKGTDGYLGYWKQLRANGVKVDDSWDTAYESSFTAGGGGGDRPIVVSYASSPPATIVFAEDPKPTEPTTASIDPTCYRLAEYAGVLAGGAHPVASGQLLDFLVSKQFQEELPMTNFVYPARTDAVLPDLFATFAPRPASPLRLDPADIAKHREEWIDAWTTAVLR